MPTPRGAVLGLSMTFLCLLTMAFVLSACGPQELLLQLSECPPGHAEPHEEWTATVDSVPAAWRSNAEAGPAMNLLAAVKEGFGDFLGGEAHSRPTVSFSSQGTGSLSEALRMSPEQWRTAGMPWELGRAISEALERAAARSRQRELLVRALRQAQSSEVSHNPGLAQLVHGLARNDPGNVNATSVAAVLINHVTDVPLKTALCSELMGALQVPPQDLIGPGRPCPTASAPPPPRPPTWAEVQPILLRSCSRCHGATTTGSGRTDFRLDVYETVGNVKGARDMAPRIRARAVVLFTMPPASASAPLNTERELLGRWVEAGAPGPSP